jgi:hypothetical protein
MECIMARASLVERIWYETSVPVFLERFMLPALAAVLVAVILLNPFKLDWQQQGSLAIAVVAVAYFVGHTVHKTNRRVQMPAVLAFEEAALSDMSVFLGANGIEISLPVKRLLRGPANAANLGNGSGVKMYTENGVLYVDATLTDGQRHIEIRKNTFSVTGHSYDKNSLRNAFEVVNERGEPIFQIIRRSAGIIVIKRDICHGRRYCHCRQSGSGASARISHPSPSGDPHFPLSLLAVSSRIRIRPATLTTQI